MPDDREIDDDGVRRVVAQGPDRREQARYQAPAHGERLVGLVKLLREPVVAADQEVRQQLELLGGDVAGRDVAEIVELPALGSPGVEQRIAERGEVRLAQEGRQHGHDQQDQQPGDVHRQRHRQGDERDQVLQRGEQEGEEPDAVHRLPAGPLQPVVDLRVLELLQVECSGVAHELDAGPVGEEIAEQALQQGREPAESLAHQRDAQLQGEQLGEPDPRRGPPAPATPIARTTSSTISFPTQSTASGIRARATRSTRMPTTYLGSVSQTMRSRRGDDAGPGAALARRRVARPAAADR